MRMRSLLLVFGFILAGSAAAQVRTYDKYIDSWGDTRFRGPYPGDLTASQARGAALWDKAVNLDGGMPRVAADASFRNASGIPVTAAASTRLPPAEVSKAVGRSFARVALKVAVPLTVGMELFDLAKELGFGLARNSDGSIVTTKSDPSVCTVAPCYEYQVKDNDWNVPEAWFSNVDLAASYFITKFNLNGPTWTARNPVLNPTTQVLSYDIFNNNNLYAATSRAFPTRSVAPSTAPAVASSSQEFIDAVAVKSGWPSSSAVGRVIKADVLAGGVPETGPIAVTGPATSTGKVTTTTNSTNNNVTTTTTTHNHSYSGPTVTTTNSTVVSVYSPTTNTTTTETTTTTPDAPAPDFTSSNTPLPDQPVLYERKYPTGLVGVWAQKKADLVATPLVGVVASLMPSVGSGGSCPAWNLDLNLGTWNYGAHNVAPPCYIWEWAKFFVIAGALLLARALIFGG